MRSFTIILPTMLALSTTIAISNAASTMSAAVSEDHPTAVEVERLLSGPDADAASAGIALEACRKVAASFDGREIPRFLDQYGRAAARAGEPEVAAVMFARCFLLYPTSRWAPSSLLEAASLHRHVFDDEAVAQRLARRSLATARALAMIEAIAKAEKFLAASDDAPPEGRSSAAERRPENDPPKNHDTDSL